MVLSTECITEHFADVGHKGVDLLFLGGEKIGTRDDEADFCYAVVGHPAFVFCSSVLGSQLGNAKRGLEVVDDGEGKVGSINDMVDMVASVGGLGDSLLNGFDGGVVDCRPHVMVEKVVTAITDWNRERLIFVRDVVAITVFRYPQLTQQLWTDVGECLFIHVLFL